MEHPGFKNRKPKQNSPKSVQKLLHTKAKAESTLVPLQDRSIGLGKRRTARLALEEKHKFNKQTSLVNQENTKLYIKIN
jgi:hypothetical protein